MKTVVVTGSSKGIGLGLASEFLKKGCNVVLSSFAKEEMERGVPESLRDLRKRPCGGTGLRRQQHRTAQTIVADGAKEAFGSVDIWMNNAGIANTTRALWELDGSKKFPRCQRNLTGVIYGTQVALQGMLKQGSGQIYNSEGFGSDDMV